MAELPTGAVTFLFTDIEGSTRLWEEHPELMRSMLAQHDTLLRACIETNDGHVFKTVGDAFCAAFVSPRRAVEAVLAIQQWLPALALPTPDGSTPLRVRMALHTGMAEEREGDYFGPTLNRVARLLAIGHGGQVLLSSAARELLCEVLPAAAGLQPLGEHLLKDLGRPETVFQLLHPNLPPAFPPLRSLSALPGNLPQQVNSFVGREKELAQVKELLGKTRLLTLTGSGGTGKTRLALQVAAELLEHPLDGVWLVELAALSDPALVPQAAVAALGIPEEPGRSPTETLAKHLKPKQLLLLLDNCEHLLCACASLADALLRGCPGVQLLASSREALGIAGEVTYRVPSLSLPDAGLPPTRGSLANCEAGRLFIERARFHVPQFALTDANAPALASVCRRLDGIPLALELAAARVRSMTVEELNQHLDHRFRLLTGGSRTALPRQQTLRSMIDWSHNLLNEAEKRLLWRLSVFSGDWTLAAAEAVCAGGLIEEWEALDLVTSLADKSLVVTEEREGTTRYRLLETVRQYARDRLLESDEGEQCRDQHLAYFLALAEEAEPHLTGPEQRAWLERLETEHDNLRSALEWAVETGGRAAMGLRMASSLWRFWGMRGHGTEGRQRLERALDQAPATDPAARAKALNGAGVLAWSQADYAAARALCQESLALRRELGDRWGIASTLGNLGLVAYGEGDYSALQALHHESLALKRELGDRWGVATSLNMLGIAAELQGDHAAARALLEESLALQRELGDQAAVAGLLGNLGSLACAQGDYPSARALLDESLAIFRDLGDRGAVAISLTNLGRVVHEQSDYVAAQALYAESLTLQREVGDRGGAANSLANLGQVAYDQRDYAAARSHFEEALALSRELDNRARESANLDGLGRVVCDMGDYAAAASLHRDSLVRRQELGDPPEIAESLTSFAFLAAAQANPSRATILWGAAEALREGAGTRLALNERLRYERQVALARAALGEEVFAADWAKGRAMPLEQVIAWALEGDSRLT